MSFIYCAKTSLLAKANDPIIDFEPDKTPILHFSSPKIDNSSDPMLASSSLVSAIVGNEFSNYFIIDFIIFLFVLA